MISTRKSFVIKALPLVLIVFSISIAASLQTSEAISVSADKLKFDIERGDTQLLFWSVRNTDPYPIDLEFYATGPGAELLVFEQFGHLEVKERKTYEILASIPVDYQDNIELRPVLHVLQRSQDPSSQGNDDDTKQTATAKVNVVMKTVPIIRIGENPVYTPPTFEEVKEEKIETNPALEKPKPVEVIEKAETIDEKLKRIQAANEAKAPKVDDVFEESFEEEAVTEYEPEPEYEMIPEPDYNDITRTETPKVECDFFAWFLSLFGIGKC